jgi:hypothetical protein
MIRNLAPLNKQLIIITNQINKGAMNILCLLLKEGDKKSGYYRSAEAARKTKTPTTFLSR